MFTEFRAKLRRIRVPLAGKVFAVSAGLALFVSFAASFVLYRGASHSLRQEVREHLMSVASTAALQVDPELHGKIRTRADESSEAYKKLKAALAAIRKANPGIRYVYTMRKTGKTNAMQFVVDAEKDPELVSHVGDEYDATDCPELFNGFFAPAADEVPVEDQWGTWLSGYAPIKDASGRTVAIVGLDMSLETLRLEESSLRRAAWNNFLVALLLANILSLLLARVLLRPVRIFAGAAHRVRGGDLGFQIDLARSDEIGELARTFNHMISDLKESHGRLVEQSTKDFLTGLFNHMYFHERLGAEIERAERYNHSLCLLILDVDRFKSVNDNLGHLLGDSILRQLGHVLRMSIRSIDIAARYGGDEFTVILPETGHQEGLTAAERMRKAIEDHPFCAVPLQDADSAESGPNGRQVVRLTVTVGMANFPEHHRTKDGLVMAADIALCRAKHVARNTVCVYDRKIGGPDQIDPEDLYQVLRDPNTAAIRSLAAAVDAKDRYTHGHSERVTDYALLMGVALHLAPDALDTLKVAGLLHDLGKIGVPDSVLNKPGGLTQEEREMVRQHPSVGGNILSRAPQLDLIIPAVLFHHERWDGAGYPDGLSGESIPLIARVLAIADAFDAMTSDRPYRKAMSIEEAIGELRANAGTQFDPDIVETFISELPAAIQKMAA